MMKFVSRRIDYSPVLEDMDAHVSDLKEDMKKKGYRLCSESEIGIYSVVLVFQAA